jgi:hypothetical protein
MSSGKKMNKTKLSPRAKMVLASLAVVIVVILVAFSPFLTAGEGTDRYEMGQTAWSIIMPSGVQANVTVLGSSSATSDIVSLLKNKTSNVQSIEDVEGLNGTADIVCIDGGAFPDGLDDGPIVVLRTLLLNGTPLIVVNDSAGILASLVEGQNIPWVYANSTTDSPIAVRALKYDPLGGESGSLDLGGRVGDQDQMAEAVSHAYDWASSRLQNAEPSGIEEEDEYQIYVAYTYSYYSGDLFQPYGRLAVSNSYVRWTWNNTGSAEPKEQWYVHYRMESDPGYGVYNDGFHTGTLSIDSTIGSDPHMLARYGPSTTFGGDRVGIYLTPNSFDYLGRWDYSIRDVTVHDHSDFSINKFALDHDLDSGKLVSKFPYIAEPGIALIVGQNGSYSFSEEYGVTWQQPSLFVWESHSANLQVNGKVTSS